MLCKLHFLAAWALGLAAAFSETSLGAHRACYLGPRHGCRLKIQVLCIVTPERKKCSFRNRSKTKEAPDLCPLLFCRKTEKGRRLARGLITVPYKRDKLLQRSRRWVKGQGRPGGCGRGRVNKMGPPLPVFSTLTPNLQRSFLTCVL